MAPRLTRQKIKSVGLKNGALIRMNRKEAPQIADRRSSRRMLAVDMILTDCEGGCCWISILLFMALHQALAGLQARRRITLDDLDNVGNGFESLVVLRSHLPPALYRTCQCVEQPFFDVSASPPRVATFTICIQFEADDYWKSRCKCDRHHQDGSAAVSFTPFSLNSFVAFNAHGALTYVYL